ncbi:MAG: HAMP domain-containing sensor histidine kinase [Prolixibacteraceae bacterium]
MNKRIFKKYLSIYLIEMLVIWTLASIISYVFNNGISFIDLLILKVSDMLVFHRILFILIGWFFTSLILMYNTINKLHDSERKLQELNRTKDKFFSIIAHDMRGPFSGFLVFTKVLIDEYDNLDKEKIFQMAKNMDKSAKILYDFLENLLDWSRSQMGKLDFVPAKIDLFEVVERNVQLLSATAEGKSINLNHSIPQNTFIFADTDMLNTILRNLISNALKFTHEGGRVAVKIEKHDDSFMRISVEDTGIGMLKEDIEKIFKIDTKYSTPGTNNEKGTGLGLILCKELTGKHKGDIWVESEEDRGTTVYFTIPFRDF